MTLECPRSRSLSRCGDSRGEGRQGNERGICCRRISIVFRFDLLLSLSDLFLLKQQKNRDDPRAFYALLVERTEELLPYVYTPTVGEVKKTRRREAKREQESEVAAEERR